MLRANPVRRVLGPKIQPVGKPWAQKRSMKVVRWLPKRSAPQRWAI